MIKIVETYSDRILADVKIETIAWESTTDANGLITSAYVPTTLPEFRARTSPYKSNKDREKAILKEKLHVVGLNKDIVLLIVRHEEKNLSIITRPIFGNNVQLYSVKVNNVPFHQYNKTMDIDKELLGKMNLIYNIISKIDKKDFNALSLTIYAIIQSYTNTGVVSKKDLVWLNGIYTKYKRLGDLYEWNEN